MSLHTDPKERLRVEILFWEIQYSITGNPVDKLNAESAQRKLAQMETLEAAERKQGKVFSD